MDINAATNAVRACAEQNEWVALAAAIDESVVLIQRSRAGDREAENLVTAIVAQARHAKWEVRRAVAQAAGASRDVQFDAVLESLVVDENARVKQAAQSAMARRRDWRSGRGFVRQHDDAVTSILDAAEVRFGAEARTAVRRAGGVIANIFARELHHEVIKLVSPLALASERLAELAAEKSLNREAIAAEATRVRRNVRQLAAVLDAMRAFTATPRLVYSDEVIGDVVHEATGVASAVQRGAPSFDIRLQGDIVACVARGRLIQALTAVMVNAIEAYNSEEPRSPIRVTAELSGQNVVIAIEDSGCGMSEAALDDAFKLFATSKPNGTGFGLALARKIIETEHEGMISIESRKGEGTTVRFAVPIRRPGGPI